MLGPYLHLANLARQLGSALLLREQTGWSRFSVWLGRGAMRSIPVAAGSVGMGCIGFPYHPVWEVTQACNLRCIHCHAASEEPAHDELTTSEGYALIDQLAAERRFGMLVYTGGEPMVRGDLFDLLAHSKKTGLVNVIATNGTLIGTPEAKELKRLGVKGLAISLDHTSPDEHNRIRGNPTAFERALGGMQACRDEGILLQVNFTAMAANLDNVVEMLRLCDELGASIILCYQLVPVGRGKRVSALTVEENAALMEKIARLQTDLSLVVEPVAAPQYWAFLISRATRNGHMRNALARRLFHGCTAGWGLVYIKANGEVWPCPFVPLSGGNVRCQSFGDIWRNSRLFQDMRDRNKLKGSCGSCDQRFICGGCRGKAYAASGDPLGEDPICFLRDQSPPGVRDVCDKGDKRYSS